MAETILAFDFGEKRTGVAVGNSLLRHARALTTLHAESTAERFAAIGALIAEWQPQRLVVGIPRATDGSAHTMTARCERFANQLNGRYNLPVERVDERYTSAAAESLRRAQRQAAPGRGAARGVVAVDPLAAEIILQSYFDTEHDAHAESASAASTSTESTHAKPGHAA